MWVAQLWRSMCGLALRAPSRVPAAARTISHTHWRVSARPRTLRKSARCIAPARAASAGRPTFDVLVERLDGAATERDDALLVAFAADLGAGLVEMQVLFAESDDLAHAQATGVEQFEDGVVAECERGGVGSYVRIAGGGGAAVEHVGYFGFGKRLGENLPACGLSMVTVGSCAMRLSSSSQR